MPGSLTPKLNTCPFIVVTSARTSPGVPPPAHLSLDELHAGNRADVVHARDDGRHPLDWSTESPT